MEEMIRKPQQKRSRDSLEQMMAAGMELLCQEGTEDFSVADLSARSGISIGSIYQRFGSKEKIYLALQERILEELDGTVDVAFAVGLQGELSPDEVVFRAVQLFTSHVQRHETILRSMIKLDTGNEQAARRGERSCEKIGGAFCTFLQSHLPLEKSSQRSQQYDLCFRMIFATTWARILRQPMAISDDMLTWDLLTAELSNLCCAYLFNPDSETK